METLLNGDVVPAKEVQRIQPVEGRQRVQFVQTRHNSPVLNIGQPANMDNEVETSPARRQFVAGALHITIGESESLAGLPQTKTGEHQFLGG